MKAKRFMKFYTALLRFQFMKATKYRLNFWSTAIIDIVNILLGFMSFVVIFQNVDNINGWTKNQVYFFWGTIRLIDSTVMFTVFLGVLSIPEKIKSGNFDFALIRPINTRLLVSSEGMDVASLANFLFSIAIVLFSISKMSIEIGFIKISGYIILIILMSYLYYCILCLSRFLAFWLINIDALTNLESSLIQFGYKAPGVIYKGWVKVILYTVIPFGLLGTIPTQFFTDRLSIGVWILVILVVLFFHWITQFIWKRGLKRYNSASS